MKWNPGTCLLESELCKNIQVYYPSFKYNRNNRLGPYTEPTFLLGSGTSLLCSLSIAAVFKFRFLKYLQRRTPTLNGQICCCHCIVPVSLFSAALFSIPHFEHFSLIDDSVLTFSIYLFSYDISICHMHSSTVVYYMRAVNCIIHGTPVINFIIRRHVVNHRNSGTNCIVNKKSIIGWINRLTWITTVTHINWWCVDKRYISFVTLLLLLWQVGILFKTPLILCQNLGVAKTSVYFMNVKFSIYSISHSQVVNITHRFSKFNQEKQGQSRETCKFSPEFGYFVNSSTEQRDEILRQIY